MSTSNYSSSATVGVDNNCDQPFPSEFDVKGELQAAIDSLQLALREVESERFDAPRAVLAKALEVSGQLANLWSRSKSAADIDDGVRPMKTHALATLSLTIGQVVETENQPAVVVLHDIEKVLPRIRKRIEQINSRIRQGLPILSVENEARPLSAPVTNEKLMELGALIQSNTLNQIHVEPIPDYARDVCDED